MRKLLLAGLGTALTACQPQIASEVALRHQHDQAYQRQVQLLQAERVTLTARSAGPAGSALRVLSLEVLNPRSQPGQPDTLRARVRKLARLVVADLAGPDDYQVVNAQVLFKPGWFVKGSDDQVSQSFIYPVASLR